jgi:hypothetical protein
VVCFSRIWSVPCEAWRTGSLRSHRPRASARRVASSKLRSAVADRDTSDRPVPPNQPVYLHPRSWLSSYLSTRWLRPSHGWIEGHDVSRRRRPLPPDCRSMARVFAGVASCSRASGTPVARPGSHAVLADDREPFRASRDRHHPGSVKRPSEGTIRVCLPSVGRSGYRALRRSRSAPCDANATP